jgi:hypothetical protein
MLAHEYAHLIHPHSELFALMFADYICFLQYCRDNLSGRRWLPFLATGESNFIPLAAKDFLARLNAHTPYPHLPGNYLFADTIYPLLCHTQSWGEVWRLFFQTYQRYPQIVLEEP